MFQRRRSTSTIPFDKSWQEYKDGFGDASYDFWLGNEKLHRMTKFGAYTIRLDIVANSANLYVEYDNFQTSDESQKYLITFGTNRRGKKLLNLTAILSSVAQRLRLWNL